MRRLFILLYVGVLAVLFAAWYIHGEVWKRRALADRARVFEEAHGGGARLVARELDGVSPENRNRKLKRLRQRFEYSVDIVNLTDLTSSVQQQIANGDDVVYFKPESEREVVIATLSNGTEVVQLGPFPNYDLMSIEQAIGGWMRLAADKLNSVSPEKQQEVLADLQKGFDFPIELTSRDDLPKWPRGRIARGEDIAFYPITKDRWSATTPVANGSEVLCFGPFPSFERIEQKAATTTLALVLLPAALAIALLLRPVARQLRHVENAAKEIASGDLSARVDERRVGSAKPLAVAFNNMASRTETLVRTQRELLQAVSHELRTPLSRMRFAVDLIESAKDDEERKQRLETLDAATEELDELIGELLNYVRMETTQSQVDREPIELQDAMDVWIPKHAALHSSVQFEVTENARSQQHSILANRTGFQRAIGNLLSNAGRFAKSKVKVDAQSKNGFVVVDVDDDGVGIPPDERERVFEPFVRLDNNSNGHGVGLGLALVKRIVTQHGGTVEALSSPIGGCRIRMSWPRNESENTIEH